MPFSEIALATRHYPIQYPHLSRLENARRTNTSRESYHRALELARTTLLPTAEQRTMLYLPLDNEDLSYFAWRTSLQQRNHTNALIPVPGEFALVLAASGVDSILPQPTGRYSYLVAYKWVASASCVMRMRYSADSLDVAELEWIGGTRAENERLTLAKTGLMLPFAGTRIQGEMTWRRLGRFSHWVKNVMLEFVRASARSSFHHECFYSVWEEAAREAKASVAAAAITDEGVDIEALRFLGGEAIPL
jgi:hypothetical protein